MIRLLLAMLIFCASAMAQVQTVTFAWDLSESDSILGEGGGYKLYQSETSGEYGETAIASVEPGVSTLTIAVPGLGVYYYVARAFSIDPYARESGNSNELEATFTSVCDIDASGTITDDDVDHELNLILGRTCANCVSGKGDVNGDDAVDILDLYAIIKAKNAGSRCPRDPEE
jgi:hypothetical protein